MCDSKVVTIIGIFLQCRNGVLEDALKDVFDIVLVNVLYSSVLYSGGLPSLAFFCNVAMVY